MFKNASKLHQSPGQKTKRALNNLFNVRNKGITAYCGCQYTIGPVALAAFLTFKTNTNALFICWTGDFHNFDAFLTIVQFQ